MSTRTGRDRLFDGFTVYEDMVLNSGIPKTDIDFYLASMGEVILHLEFASDKGSIPETVPNEYTVFLELLGKSSVAWTQLILSTGDHSCDVEMMPLFPNFLRGHQVQRIDEIALLNADVEDFKGQLERVAQSSGGAKKPFISISQASESDVLWSTLRPLYLVLNVTRQE